MACWAGLPMRVIGDDAITTPISWIATANVILEVGATPVFADIDPITRNIDPGRMEAAIKPRTLALFGERFEADYGAQRQIGVGYHYPPIHLLALHRARGMARPCAPPRPRLDCAPGRNRTRSCLHAACRT
jgi:hypothetical protein